MNMRRLFPWFIALCLIAVQSVLVFMMVRGESPTFDECDHAFAGYMMWHTGDYGLNPEHPPLVKLLAAAPIAGRALWVPQLTPGRNFKIEAYVSGRDWLARNDGASNRMMLAMRLATGLLLLALSLTVFLATREWFGEGAALVALAFLCFDPNVLAHSALVTTDVGISLFFLASVYAFYRYATKPGMVRMMVAGCVLGLLLATKHSGILVAPMLLILAVWELLTAAHEERKRVALQLVGGLAAMTLLAVAVLWAFYGFRYAARPAGLALSTPLEKFAEPLGGFSRSVVLFFAHYHLLPESYLMGLVDVKLMAAFYPTYLLGKIFAHGQLLYFPAVILIKSTLGLLAVLLLAVVAYFRSELRRGRELVYLLTPAIVYLPVAMLSGMNIGARHILPLYTLAAIGAGVAWAACRQLPARWASPASIAVLVLLAAHAASSLALYPDEMAYANEAWGGARNTSHLLSDSNVDWAQQLYQVKSWQERHPGEECWFAYFAYPEIDPATYGIRCHMLPTADTGWFGSELNVPAAIAGNVLISAGDLSGCEWPSEVFNPYQRFLSRKPDEVIAHSVMVYKGRFDVPEAAALARVDLVHKLSKHGDKEKALELAREGAALDPAGIAIQTAHGDVAAALGLKDEARTAWQAALTRGRTMDPYAQPETVPELEMKLHKLDEK